MISEKAETYRQTEWSSLGRIPKQWINKGLFRLRKKKILQVVADIKICKMLIEGVEFKSKFFKDWRLTD